MSDSAKLWIKIGVTVIGAVTASLGQFYVDAATMPEWARLVMVLGGSIVTGIGSLGIFGDVQKMRASGDDESK